MTCCWYYWHRGFCDCSIKLALSRLRHPLPADGTSCYSLAQLPQYTEFSRPHSTAPSRVSKYLRVPVSDQDDGGDDTDEEKEETGVRPYHHASAYLACKWLAGKDVSAYSAQRQRGDSCHDNDDNFPLTRQGDERDEARQKVGTVTGCQMRPRAVCAQRRPCRSAPEPCSGRTEV